jgi:ParB family chromosome partitioning protein
VAASELRADEAVQALAAAVADRDAALARAQAAEQARDEALILAQSAEAERDRAAARADAAMAETGTGLADAIARAEAAEFAHAETQQTLRFAETRVASAETERDEARAALARAEDAVGAEVGQLRTHLDVALAARSELEEALTAERDARQLAERRLTDALSAAAHAPAQAAPAPQVMTSPYAAGRPSLPPLEVAAQQAKAFAYAAPADNEGPPPGFTPEGLADLDRALAKASSPRAAGRAALQALAGATGWHGGALWSPRDEGDFACSETWSAYMSGLEAWETMAWRAHLEDGLVPAAAGSGEAHWADTEEMLACPRSRSAAWAELGTLATVPVVHPDGRVFAVLELVRKTRDTADPELLAALSGVAVRLAERLAAIESELTAQAGRL